MMKVGVWGAGAIGTGTVYRLASSPFVSEIHWINRSPEKIRYRVVDIEHGLAFARTCRTVRWHPQARVDRVLPRIDLLIVTLGKPVPHEASRADLYQINRDVFRSFRNPPSVSGGCPDSGNPGP